MCFIFIFIITILSKFLIVNNEYLERKIKLSVIACEDFFVKLRLDEDGWGDGGACDGALQHARARACARAPAYATML